MPDIPFTFLHKRSLVSGFRPTDLKTGELYIQQADNTILFKNDLGNLVCTITSTNQSGFAKLDDSNYLCKTQIPNITGDVCINAGSNISTVCKIQGYPVAKTEPTIGQTLQFDGSSWVPGDIAAGGNGGGGLIYYFNNSVPADLPTGNLPASLSGSFELGRTGTTSQYTVTKTSLSEVSYDPLVGFVSDVLDPNVNAIPAGLFDFNVWASSNSTTQTVLQLKVYKYNGSTTTSTLLATSDDVYTYDGTVIAQYIMSIVLPQTSLTSADRLFILFSAKGLANNKDITLYFGGNTPSHVHTTVPSVGGSGLVKVINGIMQSSASALVDADVSASAAIAGSKIQAGYFALASATGSFITTGQTGNFGGGSSNGVLASSYSNLIATINSSSYSFVGAGSNNTITGDVSNSFIGGGSTNKISGMNFGSSHSSVLGGRSNGMADSTNSTIVGGINNRMCDSLTSSILHGCSNCIEANHSSIIGSNNCALLSTGVHILGSGICVNRGLNTTYVNNLCVTGGYLSVGGIQENFLTCATGASGLINFDACSAATMYYIVNSAANFGLNLRSNSTTALNSILDTNKTLTVTFLNTNGSTAYALTGVSIDGTGRSIRWLNGSGSFPAGNTGSIDSYSITAVKTGDNLYTVLGSQGRFV